MMKTLSGMFWVLRLAVARALCPFPPVTVRNVPVEIPPATTIYRLLCRVPLRKGVER